jgi:hypothetical protein
MFQGFPHQVLPEQIAPATVLDAAELVGDVAQHAVG